MPKKLTIQDIARLAGVSKGTVSRVLNHKPDVNPATRERILRIVDEQGFVPSITASGLAGGRPRMIGVLVPALTWPFIPEIVQGIAEIIELSAYELILYSIAHEAERDAILDRILDAKLTAGLIVVAPGQSAQHLAQVYEDGFPLVLIDDQGRPTGVPWVGVDNRMGAYAATCHLIDLGHRQIAHIQGPSSYQCSLDRSQGYYQALLEAGLTPYPDMLRGDFQSGSGRACAHRLLAMPERPTAIFAANDHMAWGVLEAAEEFGLRVPEDLAVVGFDDTAASAHKRPPLTTVHQPFDEMGRRAAELLLWLVDSPRMVADERWRASSLYPSSFLSVPINHNSIRIQLQTDLIIRQSCGVHHLASASGR
jgi:LacI family transcriptional regulator